MDKIEEFKNNLLTSIEEINKNSNDLRLNSDLRVARRYCENNFIELVNDCYEFLRTLKSKKKKKSVSKQSVPSFWIAQKQEF